MNIRLRFTALVLGGVFLSGGAQAAPDGTLGPAVLSAQVSSSGSLISGAGATSVTKLTSSFGNGVYQVDFNRDVTNCFYSAVSFTNTVPIFVEPRGSDPTGVFLEFTTLGNTSTNPTNTDSQFYLTVSCIR